MAGGSHPVVVTPTGDVGPVSSGAIKRVPVPGTAGDTPGDTPGVAHGGRRLHRSGALATAAPPQAPMGAATPPTPTWRRRVRGVAWGRWVLGTLVALALVAVAVQGWVLAGVRGDLQRVMAQLQGNQPLSEKMLQDRPPTRKPAAHLIAGANVSSQPNGSLRWEPGKSWAFIRGLGYREGSLVCRQPGLYFVYSKVQLGAPGCPVRAATLHGIHKRTPRYPGILDLLVTKVVYCPQPHGTPWARQSFLGGLVRLEAGDEVFTRVQAPELVRAVDGTRSYFGMFMV